MTRNSALTSAYWHRIARRLHFSRQPFEGHPSLRTYQRLCMRCLSRAIGPIRRRITHCDRIVYTARVHRRFHRPLKAESHTIQGLFGCMYPLPVRSVFDRCLRCEARNLHRVSWRRGNCIKPFGHRPCAEGRSG